MRSATPKHLHPILGRRMVDWIVEAARPLEPDSLVVVVSPDTADHFAGLTTAVQEQALGTGDAVRCAKEAAAGADEVLILSGDTPLLTTELLQALLATHRSQAAGATVLSFVPDDIRSYGRIVRNAGGDLESIVEARRCVAGAARDRRGELLDLRLPGAICSGRRSGGCSPSTPRASCT